MTITWAPGWNAKRLLRRKVWGFKGNSYHIKRALGHGLRLGLTVKRKNGSRKDWSYVQRRYVKTIIGPVACSPYAVHIARHPDHSYVRWTDGNRWAGNPRTVFYLAVMNELSAPGSLREESDKWAGRSYTVVARVTLGRKQSLWPSIRDEFVSMMATAKHVYTEEGE